MDTNQFPRLSAYDSDPCIEEILELCDPYIRRLAFKKVPRNVCRRDILDEADELAQKIRIKLWEMLQKQTIVNPKAYTNYIAFHQAVNMVRNYDGCLSLQISEDGEIAKGCLVGQREEINNPETMLEGQETLDELITQVADAIAEMHTHQQQATICRLKEKMDDFPRLAVALQKRNVDSAVEYAKESVARQKLQSSYPPAKRKLATRLGVDLVLYK
jgi:hypothetical protein